MKSGGRAPLVLKHGYKRDISGQLHNMATGPPSKRLGEHVPVWMLWRRDIPLATQGNLTMILQLSSQ